MQVLLAIAIKSLIIAGLTLALLALMRQRSAAERSWVAHIGLLALVIMALAPLVLPTWNVEAPALLGQVQPLDAVHGPLAAAPSTTHAVSPVANTAPSAVSPQPSMSSGVAAMIGYAIPAAILLIITAIALGRLIALRARADVLVDGHWLSALARAQRRMGFKHGTALLTSNELASPISWGLVRPVILLNSRAVEASGEAEAILAHELAHVARMDWAKLLLARVATALFWFNPLVWLLAREAHQLREETADDAVLAADIADTDYAELLVGVARHECPGLLLGAHGVAPSKSSLSRRVARVLDGKSVRGPVAGSFALGVFVGAVLIAAPLAALTLTPAGAANQKKAEAQTLAASEPYSAYYPETRDVPVDLPHIIAKGVSTSVATAVAAVQSADTGDFSVVAPSGASLTRKNGTTVASSPNGASTVTYPDGRTVASAPSGATVTVYPPDAKGRRRVVSIGPNGATAVAYAQADVPAGAIVGRWSDRAGGRNSAIDRAIEMKAVGVTPEYIAAIKSALPQLHLTSDDVVQLRAVGVTPDFIQELARAGYRNLDADDITGAYAVGIRTDYIRGMAAVGYARIPLDDLIQLRAVGVMPSDVERFRRAGFTHLDVDELVEAKTMGLTPEEIRASRDDP
jgi:beta-lactamase regulating signal transducer with metallopeptidase domain